MEFLSTASKAIPILSQITHILSHTLYSCWIYRYHSLASAIYSSHPAVPLSKRLPVAVATQHTCSLIMIYRVLFCQDRLGTNIWEWLVEKRSGRFLPGALRRERPYSLANGSRRILRGRPTTVCACGGQTARRWETQRSAPHGTSLIRSELLGCC